MEQPKIVVDPKLLGYSDDWAKNVPEGRTVRVADGRYIPLNAVTLSMMGDPIRPTRSEAFLYFLPEDDLIEVYGRELGELPSPPKGFELCGETPTKEKPEGATYLLCSDQSPVWVEYHSDRPWDAPRLWAHPIPPPKRKYLKIPLEGVSWVDLSMGPLNRCTVFREGQVVGSHATIVEEDEPI